MYCQMPPGSLDHRLIGEMTGTAVLLREISCIIQPNHEEATKKHYRKHISNPAASTRNFDLRDAFEVYIVEPFE